VHRALVQTIDVPAADRFQVIHVQPSADLIYDPSYLDIARTEDFVAVRITLRRGRSLEQKRALYRAIADQALAALGVRRQDVLVVLSENDSADWSFGDGVAQYASR
jgi:phenylpyruvate tautomerase PptA (4-oxalocrotonate tautomerase family)